MEPKKVSNSLALRKGAALTKGDLKEEDCVMISFLVGTQECVAEEIRACKFDLVVASEYFQGLLRSPFTPDGPIRIKHVDPEIFRLVVEFTHLTGQLVTEVNDLEQWLKLAAAADEFLLDELGQLCTEKLEELINVDNVWPVFSKNHLVKYTSAVCEKLLSSKTEDCLKEPAFLEIDENALVKFLNLEKMGIDSEMQLVSACLEFVSRKEDGRAVFRRCALPHLRLLTLSADDDLSQLAPFLENEEKMLLILNNLEKDSLQIKNGLLVTTTLCKNTKTRNPFEGKVPGKEDFLPAELLGYRSKICQLDYRRFIYSWNGGKFVLTVEGNKAIKTNEFIDILRQTDDERFKEFVVIFRMYEDDWWFERTASVTVTSEDGICIQTVNLNSSMFRDQLKPSILNLAKGGKVQVDVTINKTFQHTEDISGPAKSLEDFLQELRAHGYKKFSLVVPTYCKCPHLNMVKPPPEKEIDLSEGHRGFIDINDDSWICLTCHEVLNKDNMTGHSKQHSHPLFCLSDLIYARCVECQEIFDAPALYEAKNAAHLAMFGTEMPWTCGGKIIIE